jgi:predicted RecB family nuclease
VQIIEGKVVYSASDLNNYLDCEHLTTLDLEVIRKELKRPEATEMTDLISRKGIDHEKNYLAQLRSEGLEVTNVEATRTSKVQAIADIQAEATRTQEAMAVGLPVIYQGAFFDGTFLGRSDFLIRVDEPCAHWDWSYEVLDTKLALESKPYFLVQLCHYSEQLARVQGMAPKQMHVLLGSGKRQSWRVTDFDAYYRQLRRAFLRDVGSGEETYPLPVDHCEICPWDAACEQRRRKDDHLSFVAWIRRDNIARFEKSGTETVAQLAAAVDDQRPNAMREATFGRLHKQAQLQMVQRETGVPTYELLEPRDWFGFSLMPEPDPGDVFFDMEADPLYEIGTGLEYLFGYSLPGNGAYEAFWGLDRANERVAFEAFVDFIVAHRAQHPSAHVYHYAPYEKSALRRLAQRHGTREEEIDVLLRGEVFVDLYAVVRQAVMVSQESYSIKKLEPLYHFERRADLRKGDDSILLFEQWLLDREPTILENIRAYNEEDCRSTYALREWLLKLRLESEQKFNRPIPLRKVKQPDELCHPEFVDGCKTCAKRQQKERDLLRTSETQRALLEGIEQPEDDAALAALPSAIRARYLLGNMLSYHRREEKPAFWEFFDRCNNADQLIEFDKDCLGGVELCTEIASFKIGKERNPRFTYRFPDQLHNVEEATVHTPEDSKNAVGTVMAIDEDAGTVVVKLTDKFKDKPQAVTAFIPFKNIDPDEQKEALQRIGAEWLAGTIPESSALMDLLLARSPRLADRGPNARIQPDDVTEEALLKVIEALDSSVLFIQGPPGTGKSTKAGAVIAQLLARGKRVGVMSNSHKAIHNLDSRVEAAAARLGVTFKGAHKASGSNEGSPYESKHGFIKSVLSSKDVDTGGFQFISGNAWHLARPEVVGTLDYLFVDEAGQMALADAVAIAPCARNLIVIGDPLQLAQVSQGVHPPGVGVSVLEHLLGEAHTVPEDRGIFLDVTHRLHPTICAFVSELIYDGRLKPGPDTAHQSIGPAGEYGSGLRYVALPHVGNSRESEEEAHEVVRIASSLIGTNLTDEHEQNRQVEPTDIIIVTPYNAQRRLIHRLLAEAGLGDIPVGTVDKFQGQEAFAVIYSTATSSAEDAPRGLDFLLDRNRLNVAISRARALSVIVCSGALAESRAKNIDDMKALSLLCRYSEDSQPFTVLPSV